jgi:hypothetical protein
VEDATTLVTNGWTASQTGIVKAGDIITIADVFAINPLNKTSLGTLAQFVVTADADSGSGAGASTISIYPALIAASTPYQNISALPANDKAITVVGNHTANMAFHKDCHALVMVPLELPEGATFKARETYNNLSVRVVKDYDIGTDEDIIRLDILYGVKTIYPELGVRVLG